ncbi:MAG TPA: hypothetical protein VFC07_11430, partial [Verrucomicrobiae bacterium]|nr:hypothetical protein [Verrucomicrobiae bacterium]
TQQQQLFLGLNHPLQSAFVELQSAAKSVVAIAAICLAGIAVNRPWRGLAKTAVIFAAAVLVYLLRPSPGWLYVGTSFPLMMAIIVFVLAAQAWFAVKQTNRADERTLMALALAVMGAAMLARMLLRARIGHLGFYQAALAGMVIAAFLVAELPKWTGAGQAGRWLAAGGSALAIGIGCANIALESHAALADQTFAVGAGRDRFYCLPPDTDAAGKIINPSTGQLVAWVVDFLRTAPPEATVCVLPEGEMINYLSRRPDPLNAARSEQEIIDRLALTQPDYVVFISRDLSETGLKEYGATGGPGYSIKRWLIENKYAPVAETGGNPLVSSSEPGAIPGAVILKKPAALAPGPKTP